MATPQDYSKLKNAELETLLKERNLPHTGKKAEMVARLHEADKTTTTGAKPTASAATAKDSDDDIKLFDEDEDVPAPAAAAKAATTPANAAAIKAGGAATRVPNPKAVPNQASAVDPAKTNDLSASKDTSTSKSQKLPISSSTPATDAKATTDPTATDPEKKKLTKEERAALRAEKDAAIAAQRAADAERFKANLPTTSLDEEIERRKKRAAKFGLDVANDETIKALERAKKFGVEPAAASGADGENGTSKEKGTGLLDSALPEGGRERRGRKRGSDAVIEETAASFEDPGLKRRKARGNFRGRGGGAGARRVNGAGAGGRAAAAAGGKSGSWMSEKDRAAAEARKARFGGAAKA